MLVRFHGCGETLWLDLEEEYCNGNVNIIEKLADTGRKEGTGPGAGGSAHLAGSSS